VLSRPKRKLCTCAAVNTNRRLPISQPAARVSVRQAFAHVRIIDLAGELTLSAQVALLNASQQATSDGVRVVILNFSQVRLAVEGRFSRMPRFISKIRRISSTACGLSMASWPVGTIFSD